MFDNLFQNIEKTGAKIIDCGHEKFKDFWLEFVFENNEILPINYSYETYEYQNAYFSEQENFENLSKIILMKNRPIALWPIFRLNNKYTMYGGDLYMPFFSKNLPLKVHEQLSNQIINGYFEFLLTEFPIRLRYNFQDRYISEILSLSYISGFQTIIGYEQLVNLEDSIDLIFTQIRKSYKSLINQSKRLFNIEIHTSVGCDLWEKFRLFHLRQSGRATRSVKTWEIQKQHVNNKKAILITVQDTNDYYLGFALFNFNDYEAVYAVGAYDREKFNLPIAHGAQWEAIKYFKDKGLKKYYIGALPSLSESDSKQYNIAKFKMGFGQTQPYIKIIN